jgi:hypothetical protein
LSQDKNLASAFFLLVDLARLSTLLPSSHILPITIYHLTQHRKEGYFRPPRLSATNGQVKESMSTAYVQGISCSSESRSLITDVHNRYIRTAMTKQYSTDPKYKDYNDYIIGRTPAARWGDPEDLKGAVIFLASPASDFVTGTSIVVDGGILAK